MHIPVVEDWSHYGSGTLNPLPALASSGIGYNIISSRTKNEIDCDVAPTLHVRYVTNLSTP